MGWGMTNPPMPVACRAARLDDLAGLLLLYRHLSPEDPPLAEADARPRLEALLGSTVAHLLVIEGGEGLMATCLLLIVPNLTRGGRPFAIVENVVTHADHRGRGLGKMLLGEALARAWSGDCYKVMIATGRQDERVLRFYEACGFRRGTKSFFEARRA